MPFETQIENLSVDQLDSLFSQETDLNTDNQDTPPVTPPVKEDVKSPDEEAPINTGEFLDDIPNLEDELEEPIEEGKEKKPETTAKDEKPTEEGKEKKPEEGKEKKPDTGKDEEGDDAKTDTEVVTVLKNTVDYLVENGIWEDFDGREDLELTQEVYAELAAKQDEFRLNKKFDELVNSTGNYGKAIISHIKNGGNPDEVIDIFKEQQQVQSIDTSTETGKQSLIEKYYKEVLGWKPEKVERTVKRLITDNEIDTEFNDVKELWDNHYQQKLDKLKEDSDAQKQAALDKKKTFVNNVKSAIDDDGTLTPKEKKLIEKSILDFKHTLDNGQKVSDFYVKFAEMQSNPKTYVQLVRFVMDPEKFVKTLEEKADSKAAVKTFNFIKNNSAVDKPKATPVEVNEKTPKDNEYKGTDFSFLLNRK